MLASWVVEEMQTTKLNDKRLEARLREVLDQFAGQPAASIPAACGGHAETMAAYRLFDNENVRFDNVLAAHQEATRRRIEEQPLVVLAQDTTEIDLTRPDQQVQGAGPLDGDSRRGLLLHVLHAFTSDGTPLGTVHAKAWSRDDTPPPSAAERSALRKATPIEEKESHRWVVAMREAQALATACPQTRVVCVADSEADIYELLVTAQAEPRVAEWIVRACQNRAVTAAENGAAEAAALLREQALSQPVLWTATVKVRGRKAKVQCEERGRRQPRQSREAEVEVRAIRVTLRPPARPGTKLPAIDVNVVLVTEVDPPAGEPPVEWMLLTSLPIESAEQVRQIVESYKARWMIEVFFRTLKFGCRVEERRFEHIDRLLPCLAVYVIVAWRTLWVCRLGRSCPDASCEVIFEPAEWQAVYRVVRRRPPPSSPPALGEMIRLVAQLGGYLNRPRKDAPGPQTVWLGLQRTRDLALCWQLFGPGAEKRAGLV